MCRVHHCSLGVCATYFYLLAFRLSVIGIGLTKTHQIFPWPIHTRYFGYNSGENEEIDTEQDRQRYGINMHHE